MVKNKLKREHKIQMLPSRGRGPYRRNDLLNRVLRESGLYAKVIRFKSKKERLKFLVELFIPYTTHLNRYEKHSITTWLKNQGLSVEEVKRFYNQLKKIEEVAG